MFKRLIFACLTVLFMGPAMADETDPPSDAVIEMAIQKGAPQFNAGDIAGCAELYAFTAGKLLDRSPDDLPDASQAILAKALEQAEAADGPVDRAWALRYALDAAHAGVRAQRDGAPAPVVNEATLPEGFPGPGPIGLVVVKEYPAHRLARAEGGQRGAFGKLFRHITDNDIAMTAPVQMQLDDEGGRSGEMAFFYADPQLGQAGPDQDVEVVDAPPQRVISIGVRGAMNPLVVAQAAAALDQHLAARPDLAAAGPPRLMGYNSPMTPVMRRYWEIQQPVTPAE